MTDLDTAPTNEATPAPAPTAHTKFALVISHALNPGFVQGFQLYAATGKDAHQHVENCILDGAPIHIVDEQGSVLISLILGANQMYQIKHWDAFQDDLARMKAEQEKAAKAQAEAQAAAHFGIAPVNGTRRPRGV